MKTLNSVARLWVTLSSMGVLVIPGCGGGHSSEAGSADIEARWVALSSRVDQNVTLFALAGGGRRASVSRFDCLPGGTTEIAGLVDFELLPLRADVEVDVELDDCDVGSNLRANGFLRFSRHLAAGGGETLRIESIYEGSIDFDGEIAAQCDVFVRALVDVDGRVSSITGDFCGRSAASWDLTVAPHSQP